MLGQKGRVDAIELHVLPTAIAFVDQGPQGLIAHAAVFDKVDPDFRPLAVARRVPHAYRALAPRVLDDGDRIPASGHVTENTKLRQRAGVVWIQRAARVLRHAQLLVPLARRLEQRLLAEAALVEPFALAREIPRPLYARRLVPTRTRVTETSQRAPSFHDRLRVDSARFRQTFQIDRHAVCAQVPHAAHEAVHSPVVHPSADVRRVFKIQTRLSVKLNSVSGHIRPSPVIDLEVHEIGVDRGPYRVPRAVVQVFVDERRGVDPHRILVANSKFKVRLGVLEVKMDRSCASVAVHENAVPIIGPK